MGLHAVVIFALGSAFVPQPEYTVTAGESIEMTLVESAEAPVPEPIAESTPPPEPEVVPPPPEPEPEPEPIVTPPPPVKPEMVQPRSDTPPPPKPPATPRPPRRTTAPARPASPSAQPAGAPGPIGLRTNAKPNYLNNPPPPYPAASKQAREEGVVVLTVAVTEQGRAASVRLHRSSGFPRLDAAALTAVQRWRFSPGRIGGIAVASEVQVPVRFKLR